MSSENGAAPRKRFVVGSVTGYSINAQGSVPWSRPPPTLWYVFDNDYCGQVVAEYRGKRDGRYQAEVKARHLNVRDRRECDG